ncbi:NAD(P)/FAD-dependent oxidoreductase [Luteibacter aegosomaticola]|uniref:NAD(P)/FAD-dependent oxidoreductase n=1 Tax=Luteibacter aegosomaticola TaxID=2911538 RepID=UPI001FF97396|nr:NAD(P)/FAD-dependent oxidoreductase [Luteibacter aegosomaticola]UPG92096.1 NAD(P)/FAD-dependent oxidoreductase [Luteibacter aegosomaticola]
MTSTRHRVVIVGGGAAGVELATRLGRQATNEVVLVDRDPTHFWKPRLHELAAGLLGDGEEAVPFLAHGTTHGYRYEPGAIRHVDAEAKQIDLAEVHLPGTDELILPARKLGYDTLVLAFGTRVNDFGTPGVLEYCDMLDSPTQAVQLRRRILALALRTAGDPSVKIRIGIVGAGATGVELAAELHHAFNDMHRYGGLSPATKLEITLMDMAPRVLPAVDPRTSAWAQRILERMGVHVRVGVGVKSVQQGSFTLSDDSHLPCDIQVWAAGVIGHDFVTALGPFELSRDRRIVVDSHLAAKGVKDIYAIGDCAYAAFSPEGTVVPPTAQAAHQQANWLAKALPRLLEGRSAEPFRYHAKGTLVSLGVRQGAGEVPSVPKGRSIPMRGWLAKMLYVSLEQMHRVTLHGYGRATALWIADRLRRTTYPPVKLH